VLFKGLIEGEGDENNVTAEKKSLWQATG